MKERVINTNCFVEDAVIVISDAARRAISDKGIFRLSLCGGGTPKPVYAALARAVPALDWPRIQLTFGDERTVPPDHEQSNYRMVKESLLDHIEIPEGNVFRMKGELEPTEAAALYERELRQVASRFGEERYSHDLLLLGVGDDGHTASLFPGTEALEETKHDVVANRVPQLDTTRITFTYPLINAARHVCFMVNSASKLTLVNQVRSGRADYPAAKVHPTSGELTWLLGQ